jgi:hypothetical protein
MGWCAIWGGEFTEEERRPRRFLTEGIPLIVIFAQ